MPIWVLLVIVCAVPMVVCLVGGYLGWAPQATLTLASMADAGPVTVLASRILIIWGPDRGLAPQPYLPAWAESTILVLPAIVAAATAIGAYRWNVGRDRAHAVPDDWCARCNADLYADRAGRFYSLPGYYLCPPEWWRPGERRHQPGRAHQNAPGPT